jgi:predicted  nucleic acid-binding Zn-ribbon protein
MTQEAPRDQASITDGTTATLDFAAMRKKIEALYGERSATELLDVMVTREIHIEDLHERMKKLGDVLDRLQRQLETTQSALARSRDDVDKGAKAKRELKLRLFDTIAENAELRGYIGRVREAERPEDRRRQDRRSSAPSIHDGKYSPSTGVGHHILDL